MTASTVHLGIGPLSIDDVVAIARHGAIVTLAEDALAQVRHTRGVIEALADDVEPHYGVSTGFGALATQVFASFGESFDPYLFTIAGVASKNVNELDLEKAIYAELEKIKKDGVNETELQKIKNIKLMDFYSQVETINGKSNNIGTYEVFFGDYRKMFDAPAAYNKVTAEDIRKVVNKYFTKANRTVGILKSNTEEQSRCR